MDNLEKLDCLIHMLKLAKKEIKTTKEARKISGETSDSATIIVAESLRMAGRMAFDMANEITNTVENCGE